MHINVACVHICVPHPYLVLGVLQKTESDSLELAVQIVVAAVWMLGTGPRPSARTTNSFLSSLQPQDWGSDFISFLFGLSCTTTVPVADAFCPWVENKARFLWNLILSQRSLGVNFLLGFPGFRLFILRTPCRLHCQDV